MLGRRCLPKETLSHIIGMGRSRKPTRAIAQHVNVNSIVVSRLVRNSCRNWMGVRSIASIWFYKFIKQKLPRNKIANGEQFLGLFDFIVSDKGNPLAGSSVVADFSETNSFRF